MTKKNKKNLLLMLQNPHLRLIKLISKNILCFPLCQLILYMSFQKAKTNTKANKNTPKTAF